MARLPIPVMLPIMEGEARKQTGNGGGINVVVGSIAALVFGYIVLAGPLIFLVVIVGVKMGATLDTLGNALETVLYPHVQAAEGFDPYMKYLQWWSEMAIKIVPIPGVP